MNNLLMKLQQYPKKRISLEELRSMCSYTYDYREQILELVRQGILVPIKNSKTDGNLQKPLYLRYTIRTETEQIPPDIHLLHPRIIANGFLLRNPEKFHANRDFLQHISGWMAVKDDSEMMSRRERSFVIFGDEKELDKHIELLESIGLSGEILGYYDTPEQCFSDYIPMRKAKMTLLVCENKDIWFNIRRLMYEKGANCLFSVTIDGVIFGQGNDITGKGKFTAYADFLGTEQVSFLYCGDIDRAGFDIFLRLCKTAEELSISLFLPAYRKMLELSQGLELPVSDDKRNIFPDMSGILKLFSQNECEQLLQILQDNKRLPQEILSYPVLAENMEVTA